MSDIGMPDRFVIKKKLELKIEQLLLKKKELETDMLLNERELEKTRKELESFKDVKE